MNCSLIPVTNVNNKHVVDNLFICSPCAKCNRTIAMIKHSDVRILFFANLSTRHSSTLLLAVLPASHNKGRKLQLLVLLPCPRSNFWKAICNNNRILLRNRLHAFIINARQSEQLRILFCIYSSNFGNMHNSE